MTGEIWGLLGTNLLVMILVMTVVSIPSFRTKDPSYIDAIWGSGFVVLAISSFSMERARRGFERWRPLAFRRWLLVTVALGTTFLAGQVFLWRQLAEQRALLLTRAHGSFFYLLSGLHAVHLAVGIALVGLLAVAVLLGRIAAESPAVEAIGLYWHFVDTIWIILFALIYLPGRP